MDDEFFKNSLFVKDSNGDLINTRYYNKQLNANDKITNEMKNAIKNDVNNPIISIVAVFLIIAFFIIMILRKF